MVITMNKKHIVRAMVTILGMTALSGCGTTDGSASGKVVLDPDKPVSIVIWHYYNGAQQATFDELVEEFNASEGKEKGIYVEGYSQGSVSDLEQAVSNSLKGEVGASELPDIFSSYADTAYSAQQQDKLVDLTQYFSKEELSEYVDSYIQEGYLNNGQELYLFPVAKSSEIMMLNGTDWEPFAQATGSTLDELETTEGIIRVAQRYYEWTDSLTPDIEGDGKAFYGRDSMSNYFVIGMKQMGQEIFEVKDGNVTIHTDKEMIHRLWEDYYVPIVKGYFGAYGKFRSDDVKTGDILAYTGSTSSALYFPDNIENGDESYPIDYIVMNAPVMEGGENYKVQQGAGMAVTRSDKEHEYAACVFLKWFTQEQNNMRFVCDAAYMPVLKEANSIATLNKVIQENNIQINPKAYSCLQTVLENFNDTQFYTTKNFDNGYNARKVLDYNLSDRASADKEQIDEAIAQGQSREAVLEQYVSEESFESWYEDFCNALDQAIGK